MNRQEIFQRVVSIVNESFDIPVERITGYAHLHDDLEIDSIDAVDLIVQLKSMVGQRMRPEAFRSVRTIDDVVDAVEKLLVEPAQP